MGKKKIHKSKTISDETKKKISETMKRKCGDVV